LLHLFRSLEFLPVGIVLILSLILLLWCIFKVTVDFIIIFIVNSLVFILINFTILVLGYFLSFTFSVWI
jgi:hypothetical protein